MIQPNHGLPQKTLQMVLDFYNRDDISRVVPHKNATVLVRKLDGTTQRECIRILEKPLDKLYSMFCVENPECKIKIRKFEILRPKNVRHRNAAKRMVCCCTIHTNVEYLRQAAIRYCNISDIDHTIFKSNEKLCSSYICPEASISCYLRTCRVP